MVRNDDGLNGRTLDRHFVNSNLVVVVAVVLIVAAVVVSMHSVCLAKSIVTFLRNNDREVAVV